MTPIERIACILWIVTVVLLLIVWIKARRAYLTTVCKHGGKTREDCNICMWTWGDDGGANDEAVYYPVEIADRHVIEMRCEHGFTCWEDCEPCSSFLLDNSDEPTPRWAMIKVRNRP